MFSLRSKRAGKRGAFAAKDDKMPRVVLDTNVLVSAVISDGKPRKLLNKGIEKQFSVVISDQILKELVTVLHRPKFKTSEGEIDRIMLALAETGEVIKVRSSFVIMKDDPADDMVLNTAYDGRADMIVSGDNHLLKLKSFKGIRILKVSEAL